MVRTGIRFLLENSLLMIIGASVAIIWANVGHETYEYFVHQWHFFINDIAMAFFFALAAKEIREAFLPGGPLSSLKKASLPIIATFGGMAGPAGLYVLGCWWLGEANLRRGWAIPCATDIAFSYLVARMIFGAKHSAIPFLLLLAIVDDALGLFILAIFYPTGELALISFFSLVTLAVMIGLFLRCARVAYFWPYVLTAGVLSWLGFYWGGIHPALSLVPIVFTMPHAKVDTGLFQPDFTGHDTLNAFEHFFKNPVEIVLCLFGLVNAGVLLSSMNAATWLVLVGLLLGKPIGIVACALVAGRFGLELPTGMTKRDLIVVGVVAGMGFTVALFVSTVAFPAGNILDGAKMGALLSFSAAVIAFSAAKLLKVERQKS